MHRVHLMGHHVHMDFETLVTRHKNAVYRQMVRVCGNQDDAEDALSEALLRAYRALDALRNDEAFRGWLLQIARRVCGRMKRKERLLPILDMSSMEQDGWEAADPGVGTDVLVQEKELKACVAHALSSLEEPYRQAYILRDVEGLSGEEAAEELGISLAALKSRLHRARQQVREQIDFALCKSE